MNDLSFPEKGTISAKSENLSAVSSTETSDHQRIVEGIELTGYSRNLQVEALASLDTTNPTDVLALTEDLGLEQPEDEMTTDPARIANFADFLTHLIDQGENDFEGFTASELLGNIDLEDPDVFESFVNGLNQRLGATNGAIKNNPNSPQISVIEQKRARYQALHDFIEAYAISSNSQENIANYGTPQAAEPVADNQGSAEALVAEDLSSIEAGEQLTDVVKIEEPQPVAEIQLSPEEKAFNDFLAKPTGEFIQANLSEFLQPQISGTVDGRTPEILTQFTAKLQKTTVEKFVDQFKNQNEGRAINFYIRDNFPENISGRDRVRLNNIIAKTMQTIQARYTELDLVTAQETDKSRLLVKNLNDFDFATFDSYDFKGYGRSMQIPEDVLIDLLQNGPKESELESFNQLDLFTLAWSVGDVVKSPVDNERLFCDVDAASPDPEELKRFKEILRGFKTTSEDPQEIVRHALSQILFSHDGFGHPTTGRTKDSLFSQFDRIFKGSTVSDFAQLHENGGMKEKLHDTLADIGLTRYENTARRMLETLAAKLPKPAQE
ncbi:MAG: hypothetical protein WCK98_08130 [bacterium]